MNDEKGVLYIKSLKIHCRNIPTLVIYIELAIVVFYRALVSLGVPTGISYIIDLLNIYLLANLIGARRHRFRRVFNNGCNVVFYIVLLWAILGTTAAFLYDINPSLLIWSYRNNLRYLIFFLACSVYLSSCDVTAVLKIFVKILPIQLVLTLVQYFAYGIRGDYLGGVFGTTMGANLYVNIYIVIVFSYLLCLFMHKKINLVKLSLATLSCIVVATLSELKIVFVELVVIFALYIIISKKDIKKLLKYVAVVVVGFIIISNALPVIYNLYPDFKNFFSLEFIFAVHDQGYSMSGDLDRLSAISTLYDKFLKNDVLKSLIGIGLGNAEYSSISAFSSAFYGSYGYLHYIWFAYAMVYLETGAIGLLLYCFLFISICAHSFKKSRANSIPTSELAVILSIMCFLLMVYNQTLRTEAAYLLYFVFSITYMFNEQDDRRIEE